MLKMQSVNKKSYLFNWGNYLNVKRQSVNIQKCSEDFIKCAYQNVTTGRSISIRIQSVQLHTKNNLLTKSAVNIIMQVSSFRSQTRWISHFYFQTSLILARGRKRQYRDEYSTLTFK